MLVTGVKSLSIYIYIYIYRLEEITPLVTGVKSYSIYITDWKKLRD